MISMRSIYYLLTTFTSTHALIVPAFNETKNLQTYEMKNNNRTLQVLQELVQYGPIIIISGTTTSSSSSSSSLSWSKSWSSSAAAVLRRRHHHHHHHHHEQHELHHCCHHHAYRRFSYFFLITWKPTRATTCHSMRLSVETCRNHIYHLQLIQVTDLPAHTHELKPDHSESRSHFLTCSWPQQNEPTKVVHFGLATQLSSC